MANQLIQEGNALYVLDQECLRQKEMHEISNKNFWEEESFRALDMDISSFRKGNPENIAIILVYYMYFIQKKKSFNK